MAFCVKQVIIYISRNVLFALFFNAKSKRDPLFCDNTFKSLCGGYAGAMRVLCCHMRLHAVNAGLYTPYGVQPLGSFKGRI